MARTGTWVPNHHEMHRIVRLAAQAYFERWGRRMMPGAEEAALASGLTVADQGKEAVCDAMHRAMVPFKIRKVREQDRPSNRKVAHG
jgi:hypothetical protein